MTRRSAAHREAGRGGPHHHAPDPQLGPGPRGRQGCTPDYLPLRARLEPFTHVDLQLAEGRRSTSSPRPSRWTRSRADGCELSSATPPARCSWRPPSGWSSRRRNPPSSISCSWRERCARSCDHRPSPNQVLDSFLLRSLAISGYAPSFEDCARCGADGRAPLVQPGGPRDALLDVPGPRGSKEPVTGGRRTPRGRCWPGTGRSSRRVRRGTARSRPAWSRPTSSGTSSAGLKSLGSRRPLSLTAAPGPPPPPPPPPRQSRLRLRRAALPGQRPVVGGQCGAAAGRPGSRGPPGCWPGTGNTARCRHPPRRTSDRSVRL